MDPYNPNNPNPNSNVFSVPGYYPTMDSSWSTSQFSFSGFQQTPNAFGQMNQMQSVQQMLMRNLFNSQFQSQPQPSPPPLESPQPIEDEVKEYVPETQPQTSKRKKRKQVACLAGNQPSRAKPRPLSKIEEEVC
ncbi:hypothetical protein Hanom_Chr10g00934491 [Helianthus anomalus]